MCELLLHREVTARWHLDQSQRLKQYALDHSSPGALIYANLEARNAIERFVFEMSVLATGGSLSDDQLQMAVRRNGFFQLLENAMNNYRKHMEFQNMCFEVSGLPLRIPIPDIRRCKRLINEVSAYCHCQLNPNNTINDLSSEWFVRGIALIDEVFNLLDPLLSTHRGVLERGTMPREILDLLNQYIAGTIDSSSVRTRLDLMQPVLVQRFRQQ